MISLNVFLENIIFEKTSRFEKTYLFEKSYLFFADHLQIGTPETRNDISISSGLTPAGQGWPRRDSCAEVSIRDRHTP